MYNIQGKMCATSSFLSFPQQYQKGGGMKVYNNTSRNIVYSFMSKEYNILSQNIGYVTMAKNAPCELRSESI